MILVILNEPYHMEIPYGPCDMAHIIWVKWSDFLYGHFHFSQYSQFSQFLSIVDFGKLLCSKIVRLGLGSKLNLFGLCGVVFLICESSNENYGLCVILSRLILEIPVVYKSISKLDQNIIEIVFKIHLGKKPITFTRIWILRLRRIIRKGIRPEII